MHERLISYLKDNRDQIIETWLLEAEIPAMHADHTTSNTPPASVPVEFFAHAFDRTVTAIESGQTPAPQTSGMHLDDILGDTCTCKQRTMGGRVCIELHDSGLVAFMSVFDASWDAAAEFSESDHKNFTNLINHALARVVSSEIEHCQYKNTRSDCPFAVDSSRSAASDI